MICAACRETIPGLDSGKGRKVGSMALEATDGMRLSGMAIVTSPAPTRPAALAARYAAPRKLRDPATIIARP